MSARFRERTRPRVLAMTALVIANFFSLGRAISRVCSKMGFGEGRKPAREARALPGKIVPRHLT